MRVRDWQQRFATFVGQRRDMPFSWGANDCCLFAADCVHAITGKDPAHGLRGYGSAVGAARLVAEKGGLRQIATDALGEPTSPAFAAVGDVVLVTNAGRELLAICNGGTALAPGQDGMAILGMDAAVAAWSV